MSFKKLTQEIISHESGALNKVVSGFFSRLRTQYSRLNLRVFGLITSFFICYSLSAQDNAYWTEQYGATSSLLSGAVVGGVRDNSAFFYNAAGLGFMEHTGVSISANVYQINAFSMSNGAGTDLDFKSTTFSTYPQMITGLLHLKKIPRLKIGYGMVTRGSVNQKLNARNEIYYNVLSYDSIPQEYIGSYDYYNTISEQWAGLAIAYKLSDNWSIGWSHFGAYRQQKLRRTTSAKVIPDYGSDSTISVVSVNSLNDVSYYNVRMVNKLSVAFQKGRWKVGLAVTLPPIKIFGKATVYRELGIENLESLQNFESFLATDKQSNLKTTYKSPWSVAFGVDYETNKSAFMMTTEYFAAVSPYSIITPEDRPFLRPKNVYIGISGADFLRVSAKAHDVLNVAVGMQTKLSERTMVLAGARTNFNYYQNDRGGLVGMILSPNYWNLYHVTAGITRKRKSGDMTFGVDVGFAWAYDRPQFVNLTEPSDAGLLFGAETRTADIRFNTISFVLGFTHFRN